MLSHRKCVSVRLCSVTLSAFMLVSVGCTAAVGSATTNSNVSHDTLHIQDLYHEAVRDCLEDRNPPNLVIVDDLSRKISPETDFYTLEAQPARLVWRERATYGVSKWRRRDIDDVKLRIRRDFAAYLLKQEGGENLVKAVFVHELAHFVQHIRKDGPYATLESEKDADLFAAECMGSRAVVSMLVLTQAFVYHDLDSIPERIAERMDEMFQKRIQHVKSH